MNDNHNGKEKISVSFSVFRIVVTLSLLPYCIPAQAWTGKVIGIADGDTINALRNREQVKIRLHGIDTPEKAQAFGNKTKKFTASLVSRKIVDIESVTKDRYGRIVALVRVVEKNVN